MHNSIFSFLLMMALGWSFGAHGQTGRLSAELYCPQGVTFSESCIQAAIDALPIEGGTVVIGSGTWNVSSGIEIDRENVRLEGLGVATRLQLTGSSSTTLVTIRNRNVTIAKMRLQSTPESDGAPKGKAIDVWDGNQVFISEVSVWYLTDAVRILNGSFGVHVSDFSFNHCRNCILIDNGLASDNNAEYDKASTDLFVSNGIIAPCDSRLDTRGTPNDPSDDRPRCGTGALSQGVGIHWVNGDGVTVSNVDIIGGVKSVDLVPLQYQEASGGYFSQVQFDSPVGQGLVLYPSGGNVRSILVSNSSASSSSEQAGVLLSGTNGIIDGFQWAAGRILNNAKQGIHIAKDVAAVEIRNIVIQGANIYGNSTLANNAWDGIYIASGVTDVSLTGNRIGKGSCCTGTNQQRYGVYVATGGSGAERILVVGNNLTGNNSGGSSVPGAAGLVATNLQ